MSGDAVWTPTGEAFLWLALVVDIVVLVAVAAISRRRGR